MRQRMLKTLLAGTALSAAFAGASLAQEVTLKTLDQTFSVQGEIVAYDGQNYTLRTAIGNVTVAANLVVCEGDGCPSLEETTTEFVVAGDRLLGLRLMPALLREFGESYGSTVQTLSADGTSMVMNVTGGNIGGETKMTILPTSSSAGIDTLFKGEAQFALSTRPARPREIRAFEEFGLGDLDSDSQETILALDGLLLITHPENPVRAITEANAAQVFSGRIENWAQLGGRNAPINVYIRDDESGSLEVFDTLVMRPSNQTMSANAIVLDSDEAISQAVANDPNGIGFTSFAAVGEAQPLAIRGECGLQIPPTAFSIKTEEYPLTRLLYAYQTNRPLEGRAADFKNFMTSDAAQELVTASGFIDQSITVESINSQGMRVASAVINNETDQELPQLREMIDLLIAADRLSTTYRFETGSARLNARAEADVQRLADLLATNRFSNKEVLFIGFTDSVGDAELNRQLSQQRAEQVQQAVIAANPALAGSVRMRAIGYGEISPLGCNESQTGRLINRRVEVWVRDIVADDQG